MLDGIVQTLVLYIKNVKTAKNIKTHLYYLSGARVA